MLEIKYFKKITKNKTSKIIGSGGFIVVFALGAGVFSAARVLETIIEVQINKRNKIKKNYNGCIR